MLSFLLCSDPGEYRRGQSPCYLGSCHRNPSSLPARHRHCDDCAPRGDDGCRGRRTPSPPEEKTCGNRRSPSHIVAYRGTLGRLTTVGQVPLVLDAYRWFLATLSPFPVFQQYTLLFTVAHGAIAQQTFEAYAAYVLPQLNNILAHSNPRPFAGNLAGPELGADEGDMTGDTYHSTGLPAQPSWYPNQYL